MRRQERKRERKQCVDRRPAEGGREFAVIKMGRIGNKVCGWESRREYLGKSWVLTGVCWTRSEDGRYD